jgi:hypothetical protein
MRIINKVVFATIIFLVGCNDKEKVQQGVSYYKDGSLRHKVILKNGKPEGLGMTYFDNGKVLSKVDWKNGKKHGQSIFYYENGKVRQENLYEEGLCLKSKDYTDDGYLDQITEYDSLGRIFDTFRFNKDGTRNFSREAKDPIFIPEVDTVTIGENYIVEIRLGNRQFSNIDVIIGDIEDPKIIIKNKPLPKKDSLTSILSIKADSVGLKKISGVVFERNQKWDSMDVIPFTHRFYVKPK